MEMQRKHWVFIYSLTNCHFLLCAKPHVGCWAYTDKTDPTLAPWRCLSWSHTCIKTLPFFLGLGNKGILRPHVPGSPNLVELARIYLWKENKIEPHQRKSPRDLYFPPSQRVPCQWALHPLG